MNTCKKGLSCSGISGINCFNRFNEHIQNVKNIKPKYYTRHYTLAGFYL